MRLPNGEELLIKGPKDMPEFLVITEDDNANQILGFCSEGLLPWAVVRPAQDSRTRLYSETDLNALLEVILGRKLT